MKGKNMAKEIKITEHGNYLYGNLDGIDFVKSGTMDGVAYGASIKLKFIIISKRIKNVNGIEVLSTNAIATVIRLPIRNEEIVSLVGKYNKLLGRDLLVEFNASDNTTFSVTDESKITLLDK